MRPKYYSTPLIQLMREAEAWQAKRRATNLRHIHKVRAKYRALGLTSRGTKPVLKSKKIMEASPALSPRGFTNTHASSGKPYNHFQV